VTQEYINRAQEFKTSLGNRTDPHVERKRTKEKKKRKGGEGREGRQGEKNFGGDIQIIADPYLTPYLNINS
jgi:hypothetical protein